MVGENASTTVQSKANAVTDYDSLCKSLSTPRLLVFSLPHGGVGDKVLEGLEPHLARDDIILDCGNEHFQNTERRQKKTEGTGIRYIGCGVSGGYQAARAGPSMCPGGDISALKEVLPLLEKVAAKDKNEKPCVGVIGKGGAGHYVKMMHNGIEHGMMSAICEAWGIMRKMGMDYEEIGDVLSEWNSEGELVCLRFMTLEAFLTNYNREAPSLSPSAPIYLTNATQAKSPTKKIPNTILLSSHKSSTRSFRTSLAKKARVSGATPRPSNFMCQPSPSTSRTHSALRPPSAATVSKPARLPTEVSLLASWTFPTRRLSLKI